MNIRNLTPHIITISTHDGYVILPRHSAPVPRLEVERTALPPLVYDGHHIPLVRSRMGAVRDLPPAEEEVCLVVSALVAEACPERSDLLYPGEAVRDDSGRVVGCAGLCAGPGYAAIARKAVS